MLPLKIEKKLNLAKIPDFSSIFGKIPWLFPVFRIKSSVHVQNPLTFQSLENVLPFSEVFQSMWEPWPANLALSKPVLPIFDWNHFTPDHRVKILERKNMVTDHFVVSSNQCVAVQHNPNGFPFPILPEWNVTIPRCKIGITLERNECAPTMWELPMTLSHLVLVMGILRFKPLLFCLEPSIQQKNTQTKLLV